MMNRNGSATLDFIQNLNYKFIELISLEFEASSEEKIRECISFRYNSVKSKLALMTARLNDVNNMVKVKSPSLLLQMQKSNSKKSTYGGQSNQTSIMKSRTNL